MKVLVIGQGGREHAIVHALSQSSSVTEIHAVPGSAGMSRQAVCHDLNWKDTESLIQFCLRTEIDFVMIGPEDPLVDGLSDRLRERGILVVGPSAESAQLEGSKIFAKEFMASAKVPTSKFEIVSSVDEVRKVASHFTPPYVLKADGLAAGKGVFICKTLAELETAATDLFEKKILGSAGNRALLEQFMPGWELSYLILTNGKEWQTLPLAQDHKRLQDGDQGPNTGGMGTVAPLKISEKLRNEIENRIVAPSVAELTAKNYLYRGILFIGIMVTEQGPQVLEYNCRFGDPETQVVLPLLDEDFGEIFKNLSQGQLRPLKSKNIFSSCVVLAAPGYPMNPEKNLPIEGDLESSTEFSYFLHAGTGKDQKGHWMTKGGRVLNAVGLGSSFQEAIRNAYSQATKANWMGLQKRSDIGGAQLQVKSSPS
ncbi:MAG: phosphoribosylamine--glycine ligase [Pseudobdellovibrionaceae bacterium]